MSGHWIALFVKSCIFSLEVSPPYDRRSVCHKGNFEAPIGVLIVVILYLCFARLRSQRKLGRPWRPWSAQAGPESWRSWSQKLWPTRSGKSCVNWTGFPAILGRSSTVIFTHECSTTGARAYARRRPRHL